MNLTVFIIPAQSNNIDRRDDKRVKQPLNKAVSQLQNQLLANQCVCYVSWISMKEHRRGIERCFDEVTNLLPGSREQRAWIIVFTLGKALVYLISHNRYQLNIEIFESVTQVFIVVQWILTNTNVNELATKQNN